MALSDDLQRIATVASGLASPGERVGGIVAAAPFGAGAVYLCAFERDDGAHGWLALDEAARPLADARVVREAASLAALCELAAESAGGPRLEELRGRLAELREHERPAGIEEAEALAAELAAELDEEPRVATSEWLDRVGALARRLEHALGTDAASPFASAMQQALPAVEELAADVERNYKGPLT